MPIHASFKHYGDGTHCSACYRHLRLHAGKPYDHKAGLAHARVMANYHIRSGVIMAKKHVCAYCGGRILEDQKVEALVTKQGKKEYHEGCFVEMGALRAASVDR